MQTTIHTCDICKKSKSKEDLAHFNVSTTGIKISLNYSGRVEFDVCGECLKKKGFVFTDKPTDVDVKANKIAVEDRICEFLSDLGVVFNE